MSFFSVLMPVYFKDDSKFLKLAFESIVNQTLIPNEIVIVEDGILTDELNQVLDSCEKKYSDKISIKRIKLEINKGLGVALSIGVENCSNELIARMDSDDISIKDRFESQVKFMLENSEFSVCGGEIAEFIEEGNILRIKKMPISYDDIYTYGKYRNPLNHMTVMFRKKDILEVGNYKHFLGLEDYYLWSRLLASGKKATNLPQVLVNARIDRNFSGRRGGLKYFKRYLKLRKLQKEIGFLNNIEMLKGIILCAGITLVPNSFRNLIYKIIRK